LVKIKLVIYTFFSLLFAPPPLVQPLQICCSAARCGSSHLRVGFR